MALVVKNLPTNPGDQETWVRSLGREDPLEKEMSTHSSILSWRIPWAEDPGGLQSMGSQRVRHDWATSLSFTLSGTNQPKGRNICSGGKKGGLLQKGMYFTAHAAGSRLPIMKEASLRSKPRGRKREEPKEAWSHEAGVLISLHSEPALPRYFLLFGQAPYCLSQLESRCLFLTPEGIW